MRRKPTPRTTIGDWWYERDQRTKIALMLLVGLILLALCIGAASVIGRALRSGPGLEPRPTPTATSPAATASTVPVVPTIAPTAAPTPTPPATATPPPPPPPTPEPSPTSPVGDPPGDVSAYDSGDPVEDAPAGADVRAASPGPDLRAALQPAGDAPAELAGWTAEGEALLWISLYEPIPDPPAEYREWLFALDLDGDVGTGRPAGSARINPDLGMEVAVGVYYNPALAGYDTYLLIWNTTQGTWTTGPKARYSLDEARTLVGLAIPLGALTEAVAQTSGVTVVPEAVKGRAAALAGAGEQKVIDFYPDLPD